MKPSTAFEEIADIWVQVVKRPFRDEDVTLAELEAFADALLVWIAKRKEGENV